MYTMTQSEIEVQVWGGYACFTRPEFKVERVSYPLMTPSAARGLLEAIYWKPQFRWQVREIAVLKPLRYFSVMRNELDSKGSLPETGKIQLYNTSAHRTQRHTLALRDVSYRIKAEMLLTPGSLHPIYKHYQIFQRRLRRGACYTRPYLGCREFAAYFGPPNDTIPVDWSEDLGLMLHDLDFNPDGSGLPRFFPARIERGVLRVPPFQLNEEG